MKPLFGQTAQSFFQCEESESSSFKRVEGRLGINIVFYCYLAVVSDKETQTPEAYSVLPACAG